MTNNLLTLNDSQLAAVDALVAGATTIDAAAAAGVSRQTVSVWRNRHPGFRAALNQRRADMLAERVDVVRRLDAEALEVLAEKLASEDETDRWKAAEAWLRMRGVAAVDTSTIGAITPEGIVRAEARNILLDAIADPFDEYESDETVMRRLAAELSDSVG